VPESEHDLLVHGLTGAVTLLHRRHATAMAVGEISTLPDDVRTALVQDGMLTALSDDEEEQLARGIAADLHARNRARHVGAFIFIPTYACTFRCSYCFQSQTLHAEPTDVPGVMMTDEQIDAAFAVIDGFRSRAPGTRYRHMLFGGEPLQAASFPVVERIVRESVTRGDGIQAITNGWELDRYASLLGPDLISWVQITLDGDRAMHDRRRFAAGGVPTFERILENVGVALELGVHVHVRVNVDTRNQHTLDDLRAELHALERRHRDRGTPGRLELGLMVVHGDKVGRDTTIPIEELVGEWGGATGYYQNATRLLRGLLGGGPHPFGDVSNCTSQLGSFTFDPRWDVYNCWEQAGDLERRVGTYHGGELRLDDERMGAWYGRHPGAIEECGTCPYIFICKGGCAHYAERQAGTMYANHCEGMRTYMPAILGPAYLQLARGEQMSPWTARRTAPSPQPVVLRRSRAAGGASATGSPLGT
jgi:uncharacterized protein